jgi:hypothetical protein
MLDGVESRTIAGPELTFDCLACGQVKVRAESFQYGERATLLHFVPVSPYTETNYVKCTHCGELFVSETSVFDLPTISYNELANHIAWRVPLIPLTLSICGALLFFVPVIGLGVNVIALLASWGRPRHWTRKLSLVGTLFAVPPTVLFVVLMVVATQA